MPPEPAARVRLGAFVEVASTVLPKEMFPPPLVVIATVALEPP